MTQGCSAKFWNNLGTTSILGNQTAFGKALKELLKEILENRGPFSDEHDFFAHTLKQKKVVWMEGELGWTAWFDDHDDVLEQLICLLFL